jgi:hypothetical protein
VRFAVQHAGATRRERRRVLAGVQAMPRRFRAVDRDARVVEERMEQADRVRAAADARDERIGQLAVPLEHLRARLAADDRVEVAHERRIRVRSRDRADDVERVATFVTQSRSASLSASFSVFEPECTGTTVAPSSFMR